MTTQTVIDSITVDGTEIDLDNEVRDEGTVDVTVALGKAERILCVMCCEEIEEYPSGWIHGKHAGPASGERRCNGDDDDEPTYATPPDVGPRFANWVSCTVKDDSVHVNVSVGDPRGSFQMTAWQRDDGTVLLALPYAGEPAPHVALTRISDGTYIVGADLAAREAEAEEYTDLWQRKAALEAEIRERQSEIFRITDRLRAIGDVR